MTPICEYLTKEILLADKKKARAVRRKAARYTMINGTLYKKSFLGPWLRCVGPLQANYILREIHEGSCSMHFGPRSVVAKAIRTGYYWPTMHMDARKLIKECNDCQIWSTSGNCIRQWKTVPRQPIQRLVQKLCIRKALFIFRKHPQTNSLIERANRSLGEGIKARLDERSKDWMGELSHVLWSHRTMIKSSNGETSFSLTYGTKAVIPAKIGMPTLRTMEVDPIKNDETP
ncbi:reverse transcriptase domain-containing protein [Tanacetum coccineum]|uniref:Reverse transcriptase domain-containing protein n=1 Tax=Tanacetum coccineum TaxID=301880 RepID=A0ABQ4YC96_9ASTR